MYPVRSYVHYNVKPLYYRYIHDIEWCMSIEEHQNDCDAQQIVRNFLNHVWISTINFIGLFQWLKKQKEKCSP